MPAKVSLYRLEINIGEVIQIEIEEIKEKLNNEDWRVREEAVNKISKLRSSSVIGYLQEKLQDPNLKVRLSAVRGLERIRDRESALVLADNLKAQEGIMKIAIANALGLLGYREGATVLISLLNDEDERVREAAARALGRLKVYRTVQSLLDKLDDPDPKVRRAIIRALGKIRDKKAIEPILKALEDPDWRIRIAAVKSLGDLRGEEVIEPLLKALDDERWEVRKAACEALGRIGGEKAREGLLSKLDDEDERIRYSAAVLSIKLDGDEAVKLLLKKLEDDDPEVRNAALLGLGRSDSRLAKDVILDSLLDPDEGVRKTATAILRNLDIRDLVKSLIERLDSPEEKMRQIATKLLERIIPAKVEASLDRSGYDFNLITRVINPLVLKYNESAGEEEVRKDAEIFLKKLCTPRVVRLLAYRLTSSSWRVQDAVFTALQVMGEETVPILVSLLSDTRTPFRLKKAVIYALGKMKTKESIKALVEHISISDPQMRRGIENSLVENKCAEVVEQLIEKLSDDPDRTLRREILIILGQIGDGQKVIDAFKTFVSDSDYDVQRTAISVLGKVGGRGSISFLIQSLGEENSPTKLATISSIGHLFDRLPVETLVEEIDVIRRKGSLSLLHLAVDMSNNKDIKELINLWRNIADSSSRDDLRENLKSAYRFFEEKPDWPKREQIQLFYDVVHKLLSFNSINDIAEAGEELSELYSLGEILEEKELEILRELEPISNGVRDILGDSQDDIVSELSLLISSLETLERVIYEKLPVPENKIFSRIILGWKDILKMKRDVETAISNLKLEEQGD